MCCHMNLYTIIEKLTKLYHNYDITQCMSDEYTYMLCNPKLLNKIKYLQCSGNELVTTQLYVDREGVVVIKHAYMFDRGGCLRCHCCPVVQLSIPSMSFLKELP